jgi:hypothetical protein
MRKNIDITPENDKGERHGLWELYDDNSILWFKCFFQNNKIVGYEERYSTSVSDKLNRKKYNI